MNQPATALTITSEPITTASAVRNERLDIARTLTGPAVHVEPPLEDETRSLLIDDALALCARDVRLDQDALGLRRGEPLVLLVQVQRGGELRAQHGDELSHALRAMTDPTRQLERHPDHDVGHGVLCTQCDHRSRIARMADPGEHGERMRRNLGFVGQRDADRLAANVEAQSCLLYTSP